MITYKILKQEHLLVVKAKGVTDFNEGLRLINELNENPDYKKGMNGLMDMREMEAAVGDVTDYMEMAGIASKQNYAEKEQRTAIVIEDNNETLKGVVDGFVLMTTASPIEHKVFTHSNWQGALDYIGLTELPEQDLIQFDI